MLTQASTWIDKYSTSEYFWYTKRLSGNDTLANGSHQAGPYLPKEFMFRIFPSMEGQTEENQTRWLKFHIYSHDESPTARAIWYNNKYRGGTRNETRITNLGGKKSALLDPENTGAIAVFAFKSGRSGDQVESYAWITRNEAEEVLFENRIGPVEPGQFNCWPQEFPIEDLDLKRSEVVEQIFERRAHDPFEFPTAWLDKFPPVKEFILKSVEYRSRIHLDPDSRLLRRRDDEFSLFKLLEASVELPRIRKGFTGVDEFVVAAQTILQRRKARSGRSLELHTRQIFIEEGLVEDQNFSYQKESEFGKHPDFLFPSVTRYRDEGFPDNRLRMLGVKNTCKDRWRQILNEANRIDRKHLLTLQEGVSEDQFREMQQENVQLVVPAELIVKYAKSVRPELQTLQKFIDDVKRLGQ